MEFNQDGSAISRFGRLFAITGTRSASDNLITIYKTVGIGSVSSQCTGTGSIEVTANSLRIFNQDGTCDDFVRIR